MQIVSKLFVHPGEPMEIDGRAEVTAVASKAEPVADTKPLDPRTGEPWCKTRLQVHRSQT